MSRGAKVRIVAGIALIVAALLLAWRFYRAAPATADELILLLPDDASFSDARVQVWLDAAREEGLHLVPMHDSRFIQPLLGRPPCAGVILPDSIHRRAADLLVNAIHDYVAGGGRLMLVFDAGTKSPAGFYDGSRSRFSDLAGVNYALYASLGSQTIASGEVSGTIAEMKALGVPPGKYYPLGESDGGGATAADSLQVQLRRYKYGELDYPSFATSGNYSGDVLLHSHAGIVAGAHAYGKGSVLFVNMPLGYLAGDTDGLPLHCFLKYFAERMLALPYLMPVPDGIGGLILDWHVDSNASIQPVQEINSWRLLQHGPYSIDFTAGPDVTSFGDKEGLDIPHNPFIQQMIREYVRLGDEVGSHGGWMHNYFATHVEKGNRAEMEKFLELNKEAVEQASGKPDLEYSAPNGDQPVWVTRWLAAHGFIAYYFTGDSGMGPTEEYRGGERIAHGIWAFPILHLDRAASFEEMAIYGYSNATVAEWLKQAMDFTADHRQVRLIYFHPPGILPYHHEIRTWMEHAAQVSAAGRFRWYTMAQIATFMNQRQKVRWRISERDGRALLDATDDRSLAHDTWWLPSPAFEDPMVIEGSATARPATGGSLVIAGDTNHIQITARMNNP
ncbi:MAG TPA: hypothetical protein VN661_10265 [Candidatus Acidoferrales bacterium]|nr:hypothetical protein [Candidatus Acidoferrales bacterium]